MNRFRQPEPRAHEFEEVLSSDEASEEHLGIDERAFPRELYWDAYARVAPATMIEFRDDPAFADFVLPDSSHIDGVDVARFTAALARVLERRGLVAGPGHSPVRVPPM